MITIKKLKTLKETTRVRKYILILQELQNQIKNSDPLDLKYYTDLLDLIRQEESLKKTVNVSKKYQYNIVELNNLKYQIMKHLNIEPSEWDFISPIDKLNKDKTSLGIKIYLDDIRSPFNLGSLFRTSHCFGVEKIYLSENTTNPEHPRAKRTSMGCIDIINWERSELEKIPQPILALELGGMPINKFKFPKEGTVIIGSEELGVSPKGLKIADNSLGRVSIPLYGGKRSLNVANATSILLQRWYESILES